MQTSRGPLAPKGHIEALRARHEALEDQIFEEQKHPATSDSLLRQLKMKKLRVKEEINQAEKHAS